jgi:hypothetical protein
VKSNKKLIIENWIGWRGEMDKRGKGIGGRRAQK